MKHIKLFETKIDQDYEEGDYVSVTSKNKKVFNEPMRIIFITPKKDYGCIFLNDPNTGISVLKSEVNRKLTDLEIAKFKYNL